MKKCKCGRLHVPPLTGAAKAAHEKRWDSMGPQAKAWQRFLDELIDETLDGK